jgi:hypothetical protein
MASQNTTNGQQHPGAALPPAMAEVKSTTADELLEEMNRMPLFMTTLDETDGEGGQNDALEALKALAYEGTKAEVAENFRQQGNECARAKQWTDAKEFYDKAIASLHAPAKEPEEKVDEDTAIEVEVNEEEEREKEMKIEEACYVNRALCNLEKSKSTSFGIENCTLCGFCFCCFNEYCNTLSYHSSSWFPIQSFLAFLVFYYPPLISFPFMTRLFLYHL